MPLSLRRGSVSAVLERLPELVRLEVDGLLCIAYPRLTGPVEEGDEVLVNDQARELGLGSGGFDVLYANLTRGLGLDPEPGAHVMTLPYTPMQAATRHLEEEGEGAVSLDGMPVVCCTVHSQLAPVCAGVGAGAAYVQVPGGAVPVGLSDAVRALRDRGLIGIAIAAGTTLGGDAQAVSVASALAHARTTPFRVAVCSVGPGIVGTGTHLGHGATALADAANVATALGGRPILAARVSDADPRDRHRGLSHHTRAVLELCLGPVAVAWPAGRANPPPGAVEVDVGGWESACAGLPLSHMGRGPAEDPSFFAAGFAAGRLAAALL